MRFVGSSGAHGRAQQQHASKKRLHGSLPTSAQAGYYLRERAPDASRWHNVVPLESHEQESTWVNSPRSWRVTAMNSMPGSAAPSKSGARGAVVIAQEIFGVNRHIRGSQTTTRRRVTWSSRPCLFDRIRRGIELGIFRSRSPAGSRLPDADTQGKDAAGPVRFDQRGQTRRSRRGGGLLLGRHAGLSRRLRNAGDLRGVLLRRADRQDHLDKSPKRPVLYHFGEQGSLHPAQRRGEDPRRGSQRRYSTSIRRITVSTATNAAATTPRARSSRASGRWHSSRQRWRRNDQAQVIRRSGRSAVTSTVRGRPRIPAQTIDVRNPATGELLGTVPNMGAAETRRAIEAASTPCPPGRRRLRASARASCASGSIS